MSRHRATVMTGGCVHGHDARERTRLQDRARALADLLHAGTAHPDGSQVLEAGCGTGAHTVIPAAHSPGRAPAPS